VIEKAAHEEYIPSGCPTFHLTVGISLLPVWNDLLIKMFFHHSLYRFPHRASMQ
jgi:hypothetical protein